MSNPLIESIYADEESSPEEECVSCGKVLAGVGLVLSAIFLYISIDVFTNGKLTSLITRSNRG
jgi:hypothetical protein